MFGRLSPFHTDRRSPQAVYECRICGHTLDANTKQCSQCGSDEIARYDL